MVNVDEYTGPMDPYRYYDCAFSSDLVFGVFFGGDVVGYGERRWTVFHDVKQNQPKIIYPRVGEKHVFDSYVFGLHPKNRKKISQFGSFVR